MKTNHLIFTVLIILMPGLFLSCSKNDNLNEEPLEVPANESVFNAKELIGGDVDIRTMDDTLALKSAGSEPASEIDITQYAIHIKDHYGDCIYLNELDLYDAPPNYRGYTGVFITDGMAYKASANYNITTKEFSAVLPYKYDIVFLYQCSWKTTNYFEGAFCYMTEYSTSNYPNRLRLIKFSVLKGSFPDMND